MPEFQFCSLCNTALDSASPSPKAIRRFEIRNNTALEGPVCSSCFNRTGKIKHNGTRKAATDTLADLRKRAENAIRLGDYPAFISAQEETNESLAMMDEQTAGLLREIAKIEGYKEAVRAIRGQIANALKKSPSASYFLRREEADRHISKPEVRGRILSRDKFKCVHCSRRDSLTLDHIISVKLGGGDSDENLQTLCRSCNSSKGAGAYKPFANLQLVEAAIQ